MYEMYFTDTEVILTGLAGVTVLVHSALSPHTALPGLPHSPGGAGAGALLPHLAGHGPGTTGVWLTGIRPLHTAGLRADKPVLTVGVNHTLRTAAYR